MARQLVVNLSSLSERPTGLSVYSQNIVPRLAELDPLVLIRASLIEQWSKKYPDLRMEAIADNLSSDSGAKGHARRLAWIETGLKRRLRSARSPLLFSPVPEAPLASSFPTVVTVHDFTARRFYPRRHPLHQYTKHYVPRVLRRANAVMTDSNATANDAVELAGIGRDKITVAPLACDTEHFRPTGSERGNYFLYLGRYAPYKNIENALEAFERAALPGVEFWLAGPRDPGFDRLLLEFRDRRGLPIRYVEYPPYEALPKLLGQAIALVFLSRQEGFGLPILEAMACGTPVVTSNVSAMPDVAGEAALLVGPDDTDGAAQAMRKMADRNVRQSFSEKGLLRASAFDWATTAEATRKAIQEHL